MTRGPSAPSATLMQQAIARHQAGRLGDAETLYRQVLARDPGHADALHLLGLTVASGGQTEAAVALIEQALARNPAMPQALFNLAGLRRRQGAPEAARTHYERALRLDPRYAAAHFALASLDQESGAAEAAAAGYERGLALSPGQPQALNNLALLRLAKGEGEAALALLRKALMVAPQQRSLQVNLARALLVCGQAGQALQAAEAAAEADPAALEPQLIRAAALKAKARPAEAAEVLRRLLARHPESHEAAMQLALLEIDRGGYGEALGILARLLQRPDPTAAHWARFAGLLRLLRIDRYDADLAALLLRAFAQPDLDPQDLAAAALSLLHDDPGLVRFWALAGPPGDEEALGREVAAALGEAELSLLLALLEHCILPDATLEQVLTAARHGLLILAEGDERPGSLLRFAVALARQCFMNEYLYRVTPAEQRRLDGLLGRFASQGPGPADAYAIAVIACYRPLAGVAALQHRTRPESLAALYRIQLDEPLAEAALAEGIERLTPIEAPVSRAVRAQYEENPYPRWSSLARLQPLPLAAVLRQVLPQLEIDPASLPTVPRILIAGCGTGRHALLAAQLYHGADLLAIDLSLASLAYGQRQARALGLEQVRFAQADIMALPADLGPFTLIECSGVLHHLGDPLAGWKALVAQLAPGGFMKVALYSEAARRHVVAARRLIAARGWRASAEEIRLCRAEIQARDHDPQFAKLAAGRDFYSLSLCRDLIFHVQEHRFTLPQIEAMIADLGLEFLGLEGPDAEMKRRYRARFPDDTALVSLANWDRFEAEEPDCFAEMIQLWLRKPAA